MLKDQEPQGRTMDSNEFVEPTLAHNFDLKESGLQIAVISVIVAFSFGVFCGAVIK